MIVTRDWLLTEAPASRGQAAWGRRYRLWLQFRRNPLAMAGLLVVLALIALSFLVWKPDLPLLYVTLLLCVVGTAIGLVYPITTVSIQNAVPHSQVGVAMGALNFFRSLVSAFVVAVMGAILLAGLGATPGRG